MSSLKKTQIEEKMQSILMDELKHTRNVVRIRTIICAILTAAAIILTEFTSAKITVISVISWLLPLALAFSKSSSAKTRSYGFIGSCIMLIPLKMKMSSHSPESTMIIIVAWVLVVLSVLSIELCRGKYRDAYKLAFVSESLAQVFTDVDYNPDIGISRQAIANTRMMYTGDRFCAEDYISARYKDVGFEQSDVLIQRKNAKKHSEGIRASKAYTNVFQGRWIIVEFNKQFRSDLQIIQKGFRNTKKKRLLRKPSSLFQQVKLESEAFHKEFKVFAQNEHEAFYIITPVFMERLQSLAARNKGKLMFCFVNNRLHIGIQTRQDSFEPESVFMRIDKERIAQKICDEIGVITQFVDELRLDNDLFKGDGNI